MNSEQPPSHRVPAARFFVTVGAQFALAVFAFAYLFPNRFEHELSRPWLVAAWAFLLGLPLSLFEYLYHRYLLHSAVLPFLSSIFRAHAKHHSLTDVRAPVKSTKPEMLVSVVNEYAIERPEQEESMMFPAYSLSIFFGLFLGLLALPAHALFPEQPVFLAPLIAVAHYYSGYEIWHAVLHLPFERFWQPLLDGRRTRRLARTVYSFHLMHHWRPWCNLAIVGFWGFAVWDHMFRTHRRPRLPLAGVEVAYEDGKLLRPLWPISTFDRWRGSWYSRSRRLERFLGRLLLRRSYGS